ncbi:MAG: hypothetical protein HKN01_09565 [Acidimicrobiia bacterium]|nr:hypothetical protein [Acidimicrobiia bacterium]
MAPLAGVDPDLDTRFDPWANTTAAWWLVNRSIEVGDHPWKHWNCRWVL